MGSQEMPLFPFLCLFPWLRYKFSEGKGWALLFPVVRTLPTPVLSMPQIRDLIKS